MSARVASIMLAFPFHLPGSPFLTHSVCDVEILLRSCNCHRVHEFQLLKDKYGPSTCPCSNESHNLNEVVLSLEVGQSYLGNSSPIEINLSLGWYAKHMREMFYAFSLAWYVTTVVPGFQTALFEPYSFAFEKCSNSSCRGVNKQTYLINGKCSSCFSVEVFGKLFFRKKHHQSGVREKSRTFVTELLKRMLYVSSEEEHCQFEEDVFWSSVTSDFVEYIFTAISSRFTEQDRAEPFLRDPYAKPLGCPDGVDPLAFVVNRISEEAKTNRLYGDYTHRWGLLGSASVSGSLENNENRGKVLEYDYEELRRKVLTRP